MTGHTPIPWKINEYGQIKGQDGETLLANGFALPSDNHPRAEEAKANTEFIVRAVNSHDDLLAALQSLTEWAERIVKQWPDADCRREAKKSKIEPARAAIKKATN